MHAPHRRWIFWIALVAFIAWDFVHSAPINPRLEPPMIDAGSGQPVDAGHCAIFK
jgi:hypothetical protein